MTPHQKKAGIKTWTPGSTAPGALLLDNGSRVGVIGGGPAGTFFSYFFLGMAEKIGLEVSVDIIEKRDFTMTGPAGCNMCGGIISESLVQNLAVEGIKLSTTVVERGIDSYVMHFDEGKTRILPPRNEKRIAAVHRGAGPKGIREIKWESFDASLLELARTRGANIIRDTANEISTEEGRPAVRMKSGRAEKYDLLVVAAGVNASTLKQFERVFPSYRPPKTSRTFISEFCLGQKTISEYLGNSMHVFLLHIPRIDFAALIPKGDYVTLCLLGREIDDELVRRFMSAPQVKGCLPPGWELPREYCHCSPRINVGTSPRPFADRLVFIGDSGTSRLYKDGIGAAYRTAKAAATTAIFQGISEQSFRRHYWPVCRKIEMDNRIGKLIFTITRQIQRNAHDRRGILRMLDKEQRNGRVPHMSTVLWDTFTGSAPYSEIFLRTLHPGYLFRLAWEVILGYIVFDESKFR